MNFTIEAPRQRRRAALTIALGGIKEHERVWAKLATGVSETVSPGLWDGAKFPQGFFGTEGFTTLTAFTVEFEGVVIQGLINHGCGSRLALNWCSRGFGVALGLWFRLWANDGDGVDAMVMTPLRVSLFFSLTLHQCSILAYIWKMRFS